LPTSQTLTQDQDSDFPRTWLFDEDGLRIAGSYVRMDEGPSEYGRKAICVLNVDGADRSLWLAQEALVSKFSDELERRKEPDFTLGEQIVVERGAEKKESANGRKYWPFRVSFPDAPRRSAREILGARTEDEPDKSTTDEDIPF
jgi:hypothetical protein